MRMAIIHDEDAVQQAIVDIQIYADYLLEFRKGIQTVSSHELQSELLR